MSVVEPPTRASHWPSQATGPHAEPHAGGDQHREQHGGPGASVGPGQGRGGRVRRLLLVAAAVAIIAGSVSIDRSGFLVVPVLFVLVVPFEKLFPRHRQPLRRPQVGTDIGYALAGPLLTAFGLVAAVAVAVISLAWLPGLALRPLVAMIPPAIAPFVGIALFDLAIYWTHRWYHEVPVLWKFHAVHHSPEHMDWVSGFRNHPFDGTLIAPAFVFLLAAGFTAEFTGALAVVQFVLGIFLHANVRWRLRPLHKLVITPEFHHWHHANEPGAINSNYSVFLPAWDLIFGTYFMPKHRRPQRYGISEPMPTGMAAQLWHPMRGMANPFRLILHPIRSVRAGFRFIRRLVGELRRSATRPRRRSHEDIVPVELRRSPDAAHHDNLPPPPPGFAAQPPGAVASPPPSFVGHATGAASPATSAPPSPFVAPAPGPMPLPPPRPPFMAPASGAVRLPPPPFTAPASGAVRLPPPPPGWAPPAHGPGQASPAPAPISPSAAGPPAGWSASFATEPLPPTAVMPDPDQPGLLPPTAVMENPDQPRSLAEVMGWDDRTRRFP